MALFGALIDWNKESEEFYLNCSVYRHTPKIRDLLIRRKRQGDEALIVFSYTPPLENLPLYLCFFSFGLSLFFKALFDVFFIGLFFWFMSGLFLTFWVLASSWTTFLLFKFGLRKAEYKGKIQRLNKEQIIRRLLNK